MLSIYGGVDQLGSPGRVSSVAEQFSSTSGT
jgi:hypothetical protein